MTYLDSLSAQSDFEAGLELIADMDDVIADTDYCRASYDPRVVSLARRYRDVLERVRGATVASFIDSRGRRCVVHPSTRSGESWQLSTVDAFGPVGHTCPPTFLEGCLRAVGLGEVYWNEYGYSFEWADNLDWPAPF